MRLQLIAFTAPGLDLGQHLTEALCAQGEAAQLFSGGGADKISVLDFAKRGFEEADGLIFIGAAGIAVRAIAPFLQSKTTDPAVLCLDEGGQFCISLLSGHIGGANELCKRVAALCGASPVITTATDVQGLFAVDDWARRQGLFVANSSAIRLVSAKLLRGGAAGLASDIPLKGRPPRQVFLTEEQPDIWITAKTGLPPEILQLVPRRFALGVGCKKDTPAEALETAFDSLFQEAGLHPRATAAVFSIDLKQNEPGLLDFCARRGLGLHTFSAAALAAVPGHFSPSAFVRSITGVDNVCERAAVLGGGGRLIIRKTSTQPGVTLALAEKAVCAVFEEGI